MIIQKYISDKIVPVYRKLEAKLNLEKNSSTSLPFMVVASPSTANTLVAPSSSNKNIDSTVKKAPKPSNMKKFYMQASKSNVSYNIKDVLQVKEVFPSLLADKVGKMLKVKNSREDSKKPRINMITRVPSRKEVIIPMIKQITELIVNSAHIHIININKYLKNSKSDIVADFIQITNNGIIITTNKPVNDLDLSTIEKFLKNINNINSDSIKNLYLSKSKLYMKIVELLYKIKQGVITSDYIEGILKEMHLFKDIVLALKLYVIKTSPKLDIAKLDIVVV